MKKTTTLLAAILLTACNSKVDKPDVSFKKPDVKVPEIKIPKSDIFKNIEGKSCDYKNNNGEYLGQIFYSTKKISNIQIEHSFSVIKDKNGNDVESGSFSLENGEPLLYAHYIQRENGKFYSKNGIKTVAVYDSESTEIKFIENQQEIASLSDCVDYTKKNSLSISLTPYYNTLAQELYPENKEDQEFVLKFFDVLEIHKNKDPLMGKIGPGISEYKLSKLPFAFMANETSNTIDLVIFNWPGEVFEGLEKNERYTALYASGDVYVLKGIEKTSIASQGENHDQLTSFSYINGSDSMLVRSGVLNYPGISEEIIDQMRNWKPHPGYMDRNHPLRKFLKEKVLATLAPGKKFMFGEDVMNNPVSREATLAQFDKNGGYINAILGTMVHEMYHVKEGEVFEDQTEGTEVSADRKKVLEELEVEEVKMLYTLYKDIAFRLGDSLTDESLDQANLMKDLAFVIQEIKTKYPNAWDFIWEYEYTEGFAEYVSAQSMVESLVTTLKGQIKLQQSDARNNFVYRTGSIGGLYMYYSLKDMFFANGEHKKMSVWEIILKEKGITSSNVSLVELFETYNTKLSESNIDEIERVKEYLISTVRDM